MTAVVANTVTYFSENILVELSSQMSWFRQKSRMYVKADKKRDGATAAVLLYLLLQIYYLLWIWCLCFLHNSKLKRIYQKILFIVFAKHVTSILFKRVKTANERHKCFMPEVFFITIKTSKQTGLFETKIKTDLNWRSSKENVKMKHECILLSFVLG